MALPTPNPRPATQAEASGACAGAARRTSVVRLCDVHDLGVKQDVDTAAQEVGLLRASKHFRHTHAQIRASDRRPTPG